MNLNMRASAVLAWLPDGERADLDGFGPQLVYPPPHPNPESWWCLEDVRRQNAHQSGRPSTTLNLFYGSRPSKNSD
jgi:hypothetical protein